MKDIHTAEELEQLALTALRLAAATADPEMRKSHLDQAAVYATRAEHARGQRSAPPV